MYPEIHWSGEALTDFQNLRMLRRAPLFLPCLICVAACHEQSWTSLGRAPLVGAAGPTDRINAVAIDRSDPADLLLGAAASGGVRKSHDSGATRNRISESQPDPASIRSRSRQAPPRSSTPGWERRPSINLHK